MKMNLITSIAGITCSFFTLILPIATRAQYLPNLTVDSSNRYLVTEEGQPFFWLGDTAWELFHRLDREEAKRYLVNRSAKGFTVIQAVVLAELDGLNTGNAYGHTPLINNDPTFPREAYFKHVDYIVDLAEELGMYIGMLPTWGDKFNKKWGVGPEVFTPQNAKYFGSYLADRYKNKPIIWILGGDRNPDSEGDLDIIHAMAQGIREVCQENQLITYHPQGRENSATWFHGADWIDFHMLQSGHNNTARANYEYIVENHSLKNPIPTVDGEPCYEDHPVKNDAWKNRQQPDVYLPWFDEYDIRVPAYQAILSGAFGHTYGHHSIWQMWEPQWKPLSICRTTWQEALDHPGSFQMGYFKQLFLDRPFWKLRNDQTLVLGENPAGRNNIRAALAEDGSFAVIYLPKGGPVAINLQELAADSLEAFWFNPRQNTSQLIGKFKKKNSVEFSAPYSGRNNDWVLVIQSTKNDLPQLGNSYQHLEPTFGTN